MFIPLKLLLQICYYALIFSLFYSKIIWYNKAHLEFYNAKYNSGLEVDEINDIQAKVLLEEILLQI